MLKHCVAKAIFIKQYTVEKTGLLTKCGDWDSTKQLVSLNYDSGASTILVLKDSTLNYVYRASSSGMTRVEFF